MYLFPLTDFTGKRFRVPFLNYRNLIRVFLVQALVPRMIMYFFFNASYWESGVKALGYEDHAYLFAPTVAVVYGFAINMTLVVVPAALLYDQLDIDLYYCKSRAKQETTLMASDVETNRSMVPACICPLVLSPSPLLFSPSLFFPLLPCFLLSSILFYSDPHTSLLSSSPLRSSPRALGRRKFHYILALGSHNHRGLHL